MPEVFNSNQPIASPRAGIPRPIEAALAAVGLLVCLPVLVALIVMIRLTSRGPALFKQTRAGLNGRPFVLVKLRTMRAAGSGPQVTASNDDRITALGRILRKTKLDELPTLWNVVVGDMSLVGPRPEVPAYVDLNNPAWRAVLNAKPGVTDPVTIYLRNEEALMAACTGDRETFYLDNLQPLKLRGYISYLSKRSWLTDVSVLLGTAVVIFCPRRVSLSKDIVSDDKDFVWSKELETLRRVVGNPRS